MPRVLASAVAVAVAVTGCSGAAPPRPMDPGQAQAAAGPAIQALRGGDFPSAATAAGRALDANRGNSVAAAIHALATYQRAGTRLVDELGALLADTMVKHGLDHARGRAAWREFGTALAAVEADLATAAVDPQFSLEVCLACWEHDWNRSGEIDDRDRVLFQIEYDATGAELPEADARRRPMFRFDAGDIYWARAMIAFQLAVTETVLAYKWDALDLLINNGDVPPKMTIELDDASRIRRARELIRDGLAYSDRSRELYLAETDNDREWVPNPSQTDHPVPLVMDAAMYATWAEVTRDVRAIIDGKEGLDLRELIPTMAGFVDVGELFDHPRDLTIDFTQASGDDEVGMIPLVRGLLGPALVDRMPRSPLPARILRMARELDREEDTFERKLRYFLWIN